MGRILRALIPFSCNAGWVPVILDVLVTPLGGRREPTHAQPFVEDRFPLALIGSSRDSPDQLLEGGETDVDVEESRVVTVQGQ